MSKIVRITESQLRSIIHKVIEEQGSSASQTVMDPAKYFNTNSGVSNEKSQQARQVVNKATMDTVKVMKQTVVTIGKVTFTIVIGVGVTIFLIGKGIYKVSEAIGNSIIKFLSATGKAVMKAATQLSSAVTTALQSMGVAIDKGLEATKKSLISLKDSSVSIIKWVIGQFKSFGVQVWAKILIGASQIKEFGQSVISWLGQQWSMIQKQIGVTWDKAASWASGAFNNLKQGASNLAANAVNKAAGAAGSAWGAITGFLSEMFERLLSFKGTTTNEILSEAIQFNGKSIL